ncbi:hypothetical protein [Halalkalibacter krulwichiae]|uniref:Uncharacterized protein n=1 Tax=Halalkalibacter krulwichiae TaxID=199441 RepID=A0A1X9MFH9_9BACI|nr:hypothetical protein [Halalkalibacter krulwichiae]ARK30271.1 hypothetical protein BkAM31D_10780 [Halalkalibacter krulwichiae]
MILTKLIDKSLVTNEDLDYNHRLGLPVEVFCFKKGKTIAFGAIRDFNDKYIQIRGDEYCRSTFLFFGKPYVSLSFLNDAHFQE